MKLKIVEDGEETFIIDLTRFAYKDGVIYNIWVSERTYCAGACLGKMRVIVENGEILKWIYPMMSGGEYEILDLDQIEHFRNVIAAYDKSIAKNQ